jgi:hypothetical protein
MRLSRAIVVATLALAACKADTAVTPTKPGGLSADPEWLTFKCVKPGCDSTLMVTVSQEGLRRIAVKRLVLSDPARTDFTFQTELTVPGVVDNSFLIKVRHVPQPGGDMSDVNLLVDYTDAAVDDSPDRVKPGELSIPLLRRLIGEPAMVATPPKLDFGAAWMGDTVTRNITVQNVGYGNIALDVVAVQSDNPDIAAGTLPKKALLPGEKMDLPVVWTPTASKFIQANLTVKSSDPTVAPAQVVALATSLAGAKASFTPAEGLDFGETALHQSKTLTVEILNQGSAPLKLSGVTLAGAQDDLTASLPDATESLDPLESATLTVKLASQNAGEIDTTVNVTTNDPSAKLLQIPVKALVTQPTATPTPAELDFGNVFQGWTLTKAVTVENSGYGDLIVSSITLVGGTSNLFTLRQLPVLPATLKRSQLVAIQVEFRADAIANFTGAISVETNDPTNNFLQIPLKANGSTCDLACPLPNAVATCASGGCAIDTCQNDNDCLGVTDAKCHDGKCCMAGYWDTNGTLEDGCECQDANDNGPFCANATDLGVMSGSHATASYTGVLPTADDVDTLRFVTDDEGWFGSHTITATLSSTDPNTLMCASEVNSTSDCPSMCDIAAGGTLSYSTTNQNTTVLIKIARTAGKPVTCDPYTVTVNHH